MTSLAEEPNGRSSGARARTRSPSCSLRFRELGIVLALVIVVGATTIDNHLLPQRRRTSSRSSRARRSSRCSRSARRSSSSPATSTSRSARCSASPRTRPASSTCTTRTSRSRVVFLARRSRSAPSAASSTALIVTVARVPSLVVTLGTLYIIRGIDGAWAGGNQVNASMLPESFNKIGYGDGRSASRTSGCIAIVAVAIATYAMRSFRTARDFYAIGSDPGRRAPRRHPRRRRASSSRSS